MDGKDYTDSADFLAQFFGTTTTHAVEIRALPQESGAGPAKPRFTRNPEIIIDHLERWDGPGRACYFGVATRLTGRPTGRREDLAELPALWVDIDCYKSGITKDEAVSACLSLEMRPSLLVDSGGGVHAYWLLSEAIDVSGTERDDEIVSVLKQLAGVLAGDLGVCDLARIMRLPGTHNTKNNELRLCCLYDVSSFELRYEFSDLVEWLDYQRPLLRVKPQTGTVVVEYDPFIEAGKMASFQGVRDVVGELAVMQYESVNDETTIHHTQRRITASLIARGIAEDEVVDLVFNATRAAAYAAGFGQFWNWDREEKKIRGLAAGAERKFAPALTEARPLAEVIQLRVIGGNEAPEEEIDPASDVGADQPIPAIVQWFNKRYFVVNEEGRVLVYEPVKDDMLGRRYYRRLTFEDLKRLWLNRARIVGKDKRGKDIVRTFAEIWLAHPDRRTYNNIVFDPSDKKLLPSTLNLWRGFSVEARPGSWELLKQHIFRVICKDDEEHFEFLMGWMARLIQHPDQQGEVAVILKGSQGAGKGTLARALMHILGQHSMTVSTAKHLVGNFNGHLRDLVFLFADEAFWAGDKQNVGVLKSLITEPYLTIEAKYQVAVQMRNFIHLMMASNEDWVVPASLDSRRFFVLETSDDHANDHAYFAAINAELVGGGYGAMLHELMSYDLSDYNPRAIPATAGLNDQRIMSLPVADEWWLDVLQRGYVYRSKLGLSNDFHIWEPTVSTELLYASYLDFAARRHERRPLNRVHFGRFVRRMGAVPTRPTDRMPVGEHIVDGVTKREAQVEMRARTPCYALGDLDTARLAFEAVTKLVIDWEDGEETEI